MQKSEFESCHPWVVFVYLMAVLLVTMSGMHPVMILLSFGISLAYSFFVCGIGIGKRSLFIGLFVGIFAMGILPLFRHNGVSPLFYINDMAVTMESVFFGGMMTLLLLAVVQWFYIWNVLFAQEKLLYLVGRAFPAIALVLSMTLRLLPLLENRLLQIRAGNQGLQNQQCHRRRKAGNQGLRDLSVLVSWSLEDSLETSAAMETRGYGIRRRTSFHLYRWRLTDSIWLGVLLTLFAWTMWQMAGDGSRCLYFPELFFEMRLSKIGVYAASFSLLAGLPLLYDVCWYCYSRYRRRQSGELAAEEKEKKYIQRVYGRG